MTLDILFLVKDSTLGQWDKEPIGLYPNVPEFLRSQKDKARKLYITTTAKDHRKECFASVNTLLEGYFGRESIGRERGGLYVLPDGTIRKVDDDYQPRFDSFSDDEQRRYDQELDAIALKRDECKPGRRQSLQLQQKLEEKCKFQRDLVHKEIGELFDETRQYVNPYLEIGAPHGKDLYLARRLIAPVGYETLRTVMVGDLGDKTTPTSDPETPLIIVSNSTQLGNWQPVEVMTDLLFSDNSAKPWEVYERLFVAGKQQDDSRRGYTSKTITIEGI